MRTILAGICIFITTLAFAQRECASSIYLDFQQSINPSFSNKINEIEQFVRRHKISAKTEGQDAPVIITIPVVVHVLYKNSAQNISDEQIKSQITVLNNDFRRQNSDTNNTPVRFRPFAADVQIQFELAKTDPKGRATGGIVRKATHVAKWTMDDKIKFSAQGGDDAWDSRYYLNFWIGDMDGLLGYASVPGSPAERDGIVINNTAFGTINVSSSYNLGRTATHEVGHWLGLRHIWGDSYCGDDLVDDTPKQGNFTSGCPGTFRSSCSNGDMGDMYMNYMDFTSDACMNLFTQGQKQRMWSYFAAGGPRNSLLSSKGLGKPWLVEADVPQGTPAATAFKFYPNPAVGEMLLNFEYNTEWIGKKISVVSVNGAILSTINITSKSQKINLTHLRPGMYFIQGENGDQKIREKFIKL